MELKAHRLLLVLMLSLRVERDRSVEEGRGVEGRGEQLDRERKREKRRRKKKMVVVRMMPVKAGMMSSGK